MNPLHDTDFYKTGHIAQYPHGTTLVYANFTARSAAHAKLTDQFDNKTVFFGLQGFLVTVLIDAWRDHFFDRKKDDVIADFARRMDNALGAGCVSTHQIAALHDLGYLPLHIKALPEGARVDIKVPYFTIANTHPDFAWLTNYVETAISAALWKPITNATIAYEFRQALNRYVDYTGASPAFAAWQCHDFSMRGMSNTADAATSGAAHLLSHFGTDTIPAIDYLETYYHADSDHEIIGGSVPATEHSVMCMGMAIGEGETIRRLIEDVYPSGVVSIVADTWNFWHVITHYAAQLKDTILARQPNVVGLAKVVFRPDSGDPVKILCGDPFAEPGTPEHKGAVECLWEVFGGTTNEKGFKTLHERVGLIYGDSITIERMELILGKLAAKHYSAGNVVFGIGSYTYQHVTRDTFGMAMKATYGVVNGQGRELVKDPITDSGTKRSAKGLLRVEFENGRYVLHDQQTPEQEKLGLLKTVFLDSSMPNEETLAGIRERLMPTAAVDEDDEDDEEPAHRWLVAV